MVVIVSRVSLPVLISVAAVVCRISPDRATTSRRASPKLIVMLRAPFVIQTAACVSHAATR